MSTATLSTQMDEPNKWYTAEDLKDFSTEEKYHNIQIKQTIAACSSSKAINILLQNKILSTVDFLGLGLDDLVFEGPSHWSRLKMRGCLLQCLV
jgi:hypothetical protein